MTSRKQCEIMIKDYCDQLREDHFVCFIKLVETFNEKPTIPEIDLLQYVTPRLWHILEFMRAAGMLKASDGMHNNEPIVLFTKLW